MSNNQTPDWERLSLQELIANSSIEEISQHLTANPTLRQQIDKNVLQSAKDRDEKIYSLLLSHMAMDEYNRRQGIAQPVVPAKPQQQATPQASKPRRALLAIILSVLAAVALFVIGAVLFTAAFTASLAVSAAFALGSAVVGTGIGVSAAYGLNSIKTFFNNIFSNPLKKVLQPKDGISTMSSTVNQVNAQEKQTFVISSKATDAFKQLQQENPQLCLPLLRHFAQRTNLLVAAWELAQTNNDREMAQNAISVFKEFDQEWSKIMQAADNKQTFYDAIEQYLDKYDVQAPAAENVQKAGLTKSSMLFRDVVPQVAYDDRKEIAEIRAQLKIARSGP